MKIRTKTLLIVGLVTLCLMASLYFITEVLIFGNISKSEETYSVANARRFDLNLKIDLGNLDQVCKDWSNWDDTYSFIRDNNTGYQESNLVDQTYLNLNLNLIYYFDESNRLVFGKVYAESNNVSTDQSVATELLQYPSLFSQNISSYANGLVEISGIPMMVVSHPILTSLSEGPARGTLIMGRFFDQDELDRLSQTVGLPVFMSALDQVPVSPDFKVARDSLSVNNYFYSRPLNETAIAGYALIHDVSGKPIIILRVDDSRTAYAQGKESMMYTLVSFAIISLGIFLVIGVYLNRRVISRLTLLNDEINLRKSGQTSKRLNMSGDDELSSLGANFNQMLDKIENNTQILEKTVEQRTRDLFENKEKLRGILDASPDAIIALDLNGNILDINLRMMELSGFSYDELVGKSAIDFVAEKCKVPVTNELVKVRQGQNSVVRLECNLIKKNSDDYLAELSSRLLRNAVGEPAGLVCIVRDLTERKQLEERLFKSERLAAIGELAGMVGHDLRNPLTGIKNAAYYLRKKQGSFVGDKGLEMLNIIDKAVSHSNKIINDLLDYSRELRLDRQECSIKAMLSYVILTLEIPKNISFEEAVDSSLVLYVDESKMQRVFTNLIKNAIEAMPQGGKIRIENRTQDGLVEFLFSDTGVGISQETLSKIFVPLFTTKAQGMGFGLPICKRIVEAHDGAISVESTIGKGTTFTIAFPLISIRKGLTGEKPNNLEAKS